MTREEALQAIKEKIAYYERDKRLKGAIETLIPELTESEDERIRKELISILKMSYNSGITLNNKKDLDSYLAYLEKQKEQKPSHKFNVGDTIHCKYDDREFTIKSVDLTNMVYKYTKEGCGNDIVYADEDFELVEQKPAECLKAERNGWYVCIKDFYGGGKKQCDAGELVQAKGGMYMMCREDISPWFRKAYYEEVQNAFEPNANMNIPEQPVEWSEEDEDYLTDVKCAIYDYFDEGNAEDLYNWLKSLPERFNVKEEKQKWSEEDVNDNFDILFSMIDASNSVPYSGGHLKLSDKKKKEIKTFLKYLHSQLVQE